MSVVTDMWDKPLYEGDDVVVYLPGGKCIDGRYIRASRGRALVNGDNGLRLYPFGWVSAWGRD